MTNTLLVREQHAKLYQAIQHGAEYAATGLEEMIGQTIRSITRHITLVPLADLMMLVGQADTPMTAVYLEMCGGLHGHIVLFLDDKAATCLADLLLGQSDGTTTLLGEMEQSALEEAGNIISSFFLTSLANAIGLTIQPMPPVLVQDMCGSILDGPIAMLALESEEALLIETEFWQDERQVQSQLLILSNAATLTTLLGRLS